MHDTSVDDAVALLESLGLKEYEARCFVALTRVDAASAKAVSDLSDVPRTRVYDAVDALEDAGLVERQHANPQQFRAVPIAEATETLRADYDARISDLEATLRDIPPANEDDDDSPAEVWSLSGETAIRNRLERLVGDASNTVVVLAADSTVLTDGVGAELATANGRNVDLAVGVHGDARDDHRDLLPDADTFHPDGAWADTNVGGLDALDCLVLVDGDAVLASATENGDAHAVVGRGSGNALVAVVRGIVAADAPVDV